jgi:ribosomal protein S18 acetylase RimI-like enzyme
VYKRSTADLGHQAEFVLFICDVKIVLETEVTNKGALRLYEKLGFSRDERLMRYYLNGVDAFRLKKYA